MTGRWQRPQSTAQTGVPYGPTAQSHSTAPCTSPGQIPLMLSPAGGELEESTGDDMTYLDIRR